jgi:hypothetical protein
MEVFVKIIAGLIISALQGVLLMLAANAVLATFGVAATFSWGTCFLVMLVLENFFPNKKL